MSKNNSFVLVKNIDSADETQKIKVKVLVLWKSYKSSGNTHEMVLIDEEVISLYQMRSTQRKSFSIQKLPKLSGDNQLVTHSDSKVSFGSAVSLHDEMLVINPRKTISGILDSRSSPIVKFSDHEWEAAEEFSRTPSSKRREETSCLMSVEDQGSSTKKQKMMQVKVEQQYFFGDNGRERRRSSVYIGKVLRKGEAIFFRVEEVSGECYVCVYEHELQRNRCCAMFIGGRPRKEQASPTETNDVNMDEQDEQITDNTKAPPPLQKRGRPRKAKSSQTPGTSSTISMNARKERRKILDEKRKGVNSSTASGATHVGTHDISGIGQPSNQEEEFFLNSTNTEDFMAFIATDSEHEGESDSVDLDPTGHYNSSHYQSDDDIDIHHDKDRFITKRNAARTVELGESENGPANCLAPPPLVLSVFSITSLLRPAEALMLRAFSPPLKLILKNLLLSSFNKNNSFVLVKNMDSADETQKIKVKVLALWKAYKSSGNTHEMVLIDEEIKTKGKDNSKLDNILRDTMTVELSCSSSSGAVCFLHPFTASSC
ncbi:hypothetical protein HID58_094186 [Brassica napus]|uniref:DUF223 domain-containing protein n=1 Tax=Brassica napus TaxID=3708 RepID=A0ABQ7X840_BRANA|nr:hypothetical protein HID58_094186 [Brassica napus]